MRRVQCAKTTRVLCGVAGGDSVSALKGLQPAPQVSYISTGGGASLELIQGSLLPGIQALADAVTAAA
jgi:phosphoglycerate kinase